MLDSVKLFLSRLYAEPDTHAYVRLKSKGFTSKTFPPIFRKIVEYIDGYIDRHEALPPKEDLLAEFKSFSENDLFCEPPKAPLSAIYEAVVRDSLRGDLQNHLSEIITKFNGEADPHELLSDLTQTSSRLMSRYVTSKSEDLTLNQAARLLIDELDGKIIRAPGVPPALLFIEDQAGGWQPSDLTTIAAATGVGKSWMLALNAVTATTGNPYHFYDAASLPAGLTFLTPEVRRKRRRRVLLISLEMSVTQVYRRLAVLYARVSYHRYRQGTLTPDEQTRFRKVLTLLANDDTEDGLGVSIKVVGPGAALTPEAIQAAAADFKADVVMIDAFYMMPGKGEERWQQVESNTQQLRLHALMSNRHYMLTTQLRRTSGKTLNSTDLDSLAFSASIGHDSTNVFALIQSKNDRHAGILYVTNMKMRDGVPGQEYLYSWNHEEGLYHQQGLVVEDDNNFNHFS